MKLFGWGGHVLLPTSPVVSAAISRHIAACSPGGRADKHSFSLVKMSSKPSGGLKMTSEFNVHNNRTSGTHPGLAQGTLLLYGICSCVKCCFHVAVLIFIANTNVLSTKPLNIGDIAMHVHTLFCTHSFWCIEKCFTSQVIDFNGTRVFSFIYYPAVISYFAIEELNIGCRIHLLICKFNFRKH
jgi:hypothetical protein